MRRPVGLGGLGAILAAIFAGPIAGALGQGMLIPTDRQLPPLGIVYQRVNVSIRDQAATTRIEQEFKNPTSQILEATYLFPVPAGASVQDFAMWIDGKRTKAELVEAAQARQIYTDIVRRLKDPGLLERMDDRLFRVRVFPVAAQGRQKIEIAYSEVVKRDAGLAEYIYPLRYGTRQVATEDDFTIRVELASNAAIKSVYSPSHQVGVSRDGDHKAIVGFEQKGYSFDKDFHLIWATSDNDIGLSALVHRESPGEDGYVLFLLSPSVKVEANQRVPRDIVFVVDTSGSMAGEKMDQAKVALEHCVKRLDSADRFGIVRFATTTDKLDSALLPVNDDNRRKATEWIKGLSATGGTAISEALDAAFALRSGDARNFTIVFLTDGQPTLGITDPKAILAEVDKKNTAGTRIFTFGVGDDVNAQLLDQLSDKTRGTTVYVRPKENLETKVSSFFDKISHPVLADLSLKLANGDIKLREMYPPKLPDLFHGGQIVVLARYNGSGASMVKLEGTVGSDRKTFEFEATLPPEKRENDFIPPLWGQRKIGYLLDQIRLSGENKELVDEVVSLAKKFGIVTPYTSYLLAPDEKTPIVVRPPTPPPFPGPVPRNGVFKSDSGGFGGERRSASAPSADSAKPAPEPAATAGRGKAGLQPRAIFRSEKLETGDVAIDAAQILDEMKKSDRPSVAANETRRIDGRAFVNFSGVWIDQTYDKKAEVVRIEYLSDAYFQLLQHEPKLKPILALGERVVWRAPSGKTLVIDGEGKKKLTEEEVKSLFAGK